MRRAWRIFIAIAVPAIAILMVFGSVAILTGRRGPGFGGLVTVAAIVAILGGLIVVPGVAILTRLARGVPDVRIDRQGVVWGSDRTRDLAIDWSDVERVTSRIQKTQYLTDRLFVLHARPGQTPTPPHTIYGRFMALSNRMTSGSRFAISTLVVDHPWDEIRTTIEAHLGRPIDET